MSSLKPFLRTAAGAGLILLAVAAVTRAQEADNGDLFGCPRSAWPWTGQGPVVNVPAGIAAAPAGLISTALALAFVPADLVEAGLSRKAQDEPIPRFAHAGVCTGIYIGKGLALAAGAPFWLLKHAVWDWPRRALTRRHAAAPPPG